MTATAPTPRTLAEVAAAAVVPDTVRSSPLYRWGYLRGHLDAAAVLAVDTDPAVRASAGETDHHDALLRHVERRQRNELAMARAYRTPAKTAAQIRAQAAWSWRQAEREISERHRQLVATG